MDPININLIGSHINNTKKRQISFGSNSHNSDTFESKRNKPVKSSLTNIINILHSMFNRITETPEENTPEEDNTTTSPDTYNYTFEDDKPTAETLPDTEMARFLESDDYDEMVQKALLGKYKQELSEIVSKNNLSFDIKREIAQSGLTEEEFLDAIKKLSKSTFKAALNNPELYINYTQDASYQSFIIDSNLEGKKFPDKQAEARAYMIYFFQKNIAKFAKALQFVDTDTLNQMMDKRTTSFTVMLNSINKLTPENGKILKELISRTKEGDARQKIKLCQLVSIFQSNNFDMTLLKGLIDNLGENEVINTSALNDMFKNALLQKAGIASEIEKTNTNFNEEYIHLLFSDMPALNNGNPSWSDDYDNFLKAAVSGEFETYITDKTNKYGIANKNTQEQFEKYGLNYKQWFHPDFKEKNFDFKGKNMKIKMWERNPQEDIFIGNKTRCCTAITTGSNSAAMPIYMMNTAFNYIEVYDDKNNVKGMARIYMSDVEGKPSVVIDSIELTDIRQMDNDDKMIFANNIFQYAKEFGETITGKSSDVYYVETDSKLPVHKMNNSRLIQNQFIGDISCEKIYSNRDAGSKWADIRTKVHTRLYKPNFSA